jgi:hypothetical protein
LIVGAIADEWSPNRRTDTHFLGFCTGHLHG